MTTLRILRDNLPWLLLGAGFFAPAMSEVLGYGVLKEQLYFYLVLLTLGVLFAVRVGKRAYESFKTPSRLPSPGWLWRLIFNQLAAGRGVSYAGIPAKILVVTEPGNLEIVNELQDKHRYPNLEISNFVCGEEEQEADDLLGRLAESHAAYFVWSPRMRDLKWPRENVLKWSSESSHKAILAINTIPEEPYDLTFNSVPLSQAGTSVWRLLVRSVERGDQWKHQAGMYRLTLANFVLLMLAILSSVALYIPYLRSTASSDLGTLRAAASDDLETTRSEIETAHAKIEAAYGEIERMLDFSAKQAGQKLKEIQEALEVDDADLTTTVEFFKTIHVLNRGTADSCICEVAQSEEEKHIARCFPSTSKELLRESVIGCSIAQDQAVLWREGASSLQLSSRLGDYEFHSDQSCEFTDLGADRRRRALLCIGEEPGAAATADGVCLDTFIIDEMFLTGPATRQVLEQALATLQYSDSHSFQREPFLSRCLQNLGKRDKSE